MHSDVEKTILYVLVLILTLILSILIYSDNKIVIKFPTAKSIGYRTLIKTTDSVSVYKDCKYELKTITYDTIFKRKLSTIEMPRSIEMKVDSCVTMVEN